MLVLPLHAFSQSSSLWKIISGDLQPIVGTWEIIAPSAKTGLGTTTPAWMLQIATSSAVGGARPQLSLTDTGAGTNLKHWTMRSAGGFLYIATSSDAYATSSVPALTIRSNGWIGIGTSTPRAKFAVDGSILVGGTGTSTFEHYLLADNMGINANPAPLKPFNEQLTLWNGLDTGWTDRYGNGTTSHETTIVRQGTGAIKIEAPSTAALAGMEFDITDVNLSSRFVSFFVRCNEWQNVDTAGIAISTSGDFSAFWAYDLDSFLVSSKNHNDTWLEIVLARDDFSVGGGSPDWATVNRLIFRVIADSGTSPTCYFDGLSYGEESKANGVVVMSFDDSIDDVIDVAKPRMDNWNMKGIVYLITNALGTATTLTQSEVDTLHDIGWDIGGHGADNLTTLTQSARISHLRSTKEYLMSHGYRGADHYSYPNGAYDATTTPDVMRYFSTARTIDNQTQPINYIVPERLQAFTISNTTSTSTIIGWIDRATSTNSMVELTWHNIVPSPSGSTDVSQYMFEHIIDYMGSSSVKVLPLSQVVGQDWRKQFADEIAVNRLGIGTTTPWKTLSVVGGMAVNGLTTSTAGNSVCILSNFEIVNAGATTCSSSALRFKENVLTIKDGTGLALINQLNPVTFQYKEGMGRDRKVHYGLIADEVAKVDSLLGEYNLETGEIWSIDWNGIIAALIDSVQELFKKDTAQDVKIRQLEAKNAELEKRLQKLENNYK